MSFYSEDINVILSEKVPLKAPRVSKEMKSNYHRCHLEYHREVAGQNCI